MSIQKSRILIADPDIDIRETLRLYFEGHSHEVQTAEVASEVIRMTRQWQPNAVLMSAEFSDQNPYQICESLLEDTLTGHIPIIMLLHKNDRQARLEALEVGVGDIVTKPFDIEELHLRVRASIRLATLMMGV